MGSLNCSEQNRKSTGRAAEVYQRAARSESLKNNTIQQTSCHSCSPVQWQYGARNCCSSCCFYSQNYANIISLFENNTKAFSSTQMNTSQILGQYWFWPGNRFNLEFSEARVRLCIFQKSISGKNETAVRMQMIWLNTILQNLVNT